MGYILSLHTSKLNEKHELALFMTIFATKFTAAKLKTFVV